MAFQIGSNFELNAQLPLDVRTIVANLTERNNLVPNKVYAGLIVYVTSENKYYYYSNTNQWTELNVGFSGGQLNNLNLNTINGNTSFGIYNYNLNGIYHDQYLKQEAHLAGLANTVSGIRNANIVNFYFGDVNGDINPNDKKHTLKVNPGILVDYTGVSGNRNIIKFPDNSIYSGKAIRKIRYNSTIGNGYERINLTNLSIPENPAIIRPLTRRLETFYDISVPSGGGIRALKFNFPTSLSFVQGLCMNLRFNFEADNTPCIISGYWEPLGSNSNTKIFLLTGTNYSFIQKERVILVNKEGGGFIHW